MRRFLIYFTAIVILSGIFSAGFWYYFRPESDTAVTGYASPLPDFLTLSKNSQVRLLDLWFPAVEKTHGSGFDPSQLTAKSVLVYDLTDNKTIYQKSADSKLPMASLTKIMTAIIALENKREDNKYIVRSEDLVGEDSMGLSEGEVLTMEELLYGLMLPSGNDAAETFANNFYLGRDGFIKAMNDKAKSLGLVNTHFDNPSGLQGDGVQYTTVSDLLVITRYALENYPLFVKIVSTANHSIPETISHKAYDLYNETNLLTTYPGVKGVKTGYTPEAGLCLISYLEYEDHKIIGILLNSQNRRAEMKELLDYSLNSLGIKPPAFKGE